MLSKHTGQFAWVCPTEIYGKANTYYISQIFRIHGETMDEALAMLKARFFCTEVLHIVFSEDRLSFNFFFSCLSSVGIDSLLFSQNIKIPNSKVLCKN